MSSFIIEKKHYSRLAGVLAAIGTHKDYYGTENFYKYNAEKGRIFDAYDFKEEIMRLYDLNAASVAKQYGEDLSLDGGIYQSEFAIYFAKASKLWKEAYQGWTEAKREFNRLCFYIVDFFNSVLYQIEDLESAKEAANIAGWYSRAILRVMKKINETQESMTWGDFEFFEDETEDLEEC